MTDTFSFTDDVFDGPGDTDEVQPSESVYASDDATDLSGEPVERAPKAKAEPRSSTAQLVSLAWGGMGLALMRSGADVPVGRVLQFQAPLAGVKIDELIKNTWIDHVLQPFVKQADKIEGLGTLIAFPLLVGFAERNPAAYPLIEGMLTEIVHETLIDLAPQVKKKQDKAKRAAKSMDGINEALGIGPNDDPVQAILGTIFAGVGDPEPTPDV